MDESEEMIMPDLEISFWLEKLDELGDAYPVVAVINFRVQCLLDLWMSSEAWNGGS